MATKRSSSHLSWGPCEGVQCIFYISNQIQKHLQGHQRFTPEYVIKNQTKPHLRNYNFLHSHFLTSSQTKLPEHFSMPNISYGILKIPGKQCRGVVIEVLDHYMQQPWQARWGNKVIEPGRTICSTLTAGDWALSAYSSKPVYLVIRDYQ